ncbi:MAG: hypothetical protein R3B06_03445 [Kofleriaceae bacterium]
MRSTLLTALIGCAACHHAGAPATIGNADVGPAAVAPPAAELMHGLFAGDRTLVYDVTSESSYWDDQNPAADANGNVTSTATEAITCHLTVGRVGRYRTASIDCDPSADGDGFGSSVLEEVVRVFVTDGERLWRLDAGSLPATADALAAALPDAPVLVQGQRPVAERHSDAEDGGSGDFGSAYAVTAQGDGWCVADDSWGGDEGGSSWCLSAAHGLVSASWYFAGGASHDQRAVLRLP